MRGDDDDYQKNHASPARGSANFSGGSLSYYGCNATRRRRMRDQVVVQETMVAKLAACATTAIRRGSLRESVHSRRTAISAIAGYGGRIQNQTLTTTFTPIAVTNTNVFTIPVLPWPINIIMHQQRPFGWLTRVLHRRLGHSLQLRG